MLAKRNQPRDAVSIWATAVLSSGLLQSRRTCDPKYYCPEFSTAISLHQKQGIHKQKSTGESRRKKSLLLVKSNEKNVQIKLLHVASVLLLQIPSLHLSADQILIEGFMRLKA